jgi:hypothetical protein
MRRTSQGADDDIPFSICTIQTFNAPPHIEDRSAMDEPTISIPVTCPLCGLQSSSEFPVVVVSIAMLKWNNMRLYAACHGAYWDSTPQEIEQIRLHLGTEWLERLGQVSSRRAALGIRQ